MKHFIKSILFICLLWPVFAIAQEQESRMLFSIVQHADAVLNTEEVQFFNNIDSDNVIDKTLIDLVNINMALENPTQNASIRGETINFERANHNQIDPYNFSYKGVVTDEDSRGELYLYRTNGFLHGSLFLNGRVLQFEPVNKRYAALVQRDF